MLDENSSSGFGSSTGSPAGTFEDRHPLRGERFWSRQMPEGPWDDLVIGSGIGGLTAAALLSSLGRRVLVLEQHYLPGGFTHAFSHQGYVWDVGVHAVGEVTRHTVSGRLLEHLTGGRLKFASLGPVYEEFHFPDGLRIDFPDSPEAFREQLVEAFPSEGVAIDRYLTLVRRAARDMRRHYLARTLPGWALPAAEATLARAARRWTRRSVEEVLSGLTDDRRLRAVLTAQWGYYGTPPSRAPFAIQALITRHFLHGGYYPVGGAQEIGRELTRTIAAAGGWTRIAAAVESIVVEGGRTRGVALEGGEVIRARRVFVASGMGTAVRRLLPDPHRSSAWAEEVRSIGAGPAHLCLYLGLRGDPRRAGASGANRWFYETWDADGSIWDVSDPDHLPRVPVLYTSFPSLKDPAHDPGPEERHTAEVVTFVPWSAFAPWAGTRWQQRGEGYESLKKRLADKLLAQILERMPDLAPLVDVAELSTPATTDFFCRPLAGSIYGLEASIERFRCRALRVRAPIPGLFFAGSDVTSGGVMGAMGGGLLAALSAEPRRVFGLLRSLD